MSKKEQKEIKKIINRLKDNYSFYKEYIINLTPSNKKI